MVQVKLVSGLDQSGLLSSQSTVVYSVRRLQQAACLRVCMRLATIELCVTPPLLRAGRRPDHQRPHCAAELPAKHEGA